ncbi:MAG: hypothetical protein HRT89_01080 [Lentisphaeria bacterium]|nr:hypothetical protein [Lentisphaeria bacterium]NQZ66637.1 hypothetical protein [Lentisphaeria bacterium]
MIKPIEYVTVTFAALTALAVNGALGSTPNFQISATIAASIISSLCAVVMLLFTRKAIGSAPDVFMKSMLIANMVRGAILLMAIGIIIIGFQSLNLKSLLIGGLISYMIHMFTEVGNLYYRSQRSF